MPDAPPPANAASPASGSAEKTPDDAVPVAEGILLSPDGQVHVDEGLTEVLLDLAETLEDRTGRPVDVEHVVAAVVMANRAGKLGSDRRLRTGDDLLLMALAPQIDAVFERYGGLVAEPDDETAPGADADAPADGDPPAAP